ncbi:hypothetical protein BU16DRAFT_526033 [Lophium mytilinum]|uniref:BRCT domain-containing protein n=1 Tax=Lophium mytilinum TaxID=390894 RepID=A0A6A6R0N6_9PEZI|nr:hypothetical protein BU16DRAFT_526033 [Lophium mytilinum]
MQRADDSHTVLPSGRHTHPSDASGDSQNASTKPSPSSARRPAAGGVIPRLNASKTAPLTNLPMLEHSLGIRMNHSFAAFTTDVPGDTQPDSQIYNNYLSTRQSVAKHPFNNATSDEAERETSPDPIEPADHWDDENLEDDPTSPTSCNDDDARQLSPETQLRAQHTSAGFAFPETPAMAGRKRNNRGELLSSVNRTPGTTMTAAFFANGLGTGGGMSLTQVFNATQVATSPLPDAARSDPVFQRPSPNFTAGRSSPPVVTSSPTKLYRSDPSRATTEPRDTYLSMKESQELRERQRLAELELQQMKAQEQEEEDWMDSPAGQNEIRQSYVARSVSRKEAWTGAKGKPMVISSDTAYMTPIRSYRRGGKVVKVTEQILEEDEFDTGSNDEPPNSQSPQNTSNKLADRSGAVVLQVPMTSSRPNKASSGSRTRSSPPDSPIPLGRSKLSQAVSASQSQRNSNSQQRVLGGTQTVAIADSQPDIAQPETNSRPPVLADPSSLGSNLRISQSQFSNKSRRATQLTGLDTSSVPRPPRDSSPLVHEDDEQVPSSPPLAYGEGENPSVEDDEHDDLVTSDDDLQLVGDREVETEDVTIDDTEGRGDSAFHRAPPVKGATSEEQTAVKSSRERLQSTIPDSEAAGGSDSVFERTEPIVEEEPAEEEPLHPPDHITIKDVYTEHETDSTGAYQTARSRNTASPQKKVSTQNSKISSPSPHKARFRSLTEIAAVPESQKSLESIDMDFDVGLDGLDDFASLVNHVEPIQPRTKKRRITYGNKRPRSPAKKTAKFLDQATPPEANEKDNEEGSASLEELHMDTSPTKKLARSSVDKNFETTDAEYEAHEPPEEIQPQEAPKSTPQQVHDDPIETPPSIRRRESAGGMAAAAAREAVRFGKPAIPIKGKLTRPSKKADTPNSSVRRLASNMSKANVASRRSEIPETPNVNLLEKSVVKPLSETQIWEVQDSIEQADVNIFQEVGDDTEGPVFVGREVENMEETTDILLTPNRVFALFRGNDIKYYPATCLGPTDGTHWRVRFDDGSIDTMLLSENFRNLDLRVGDQLKVDLQDMRKHIYVAVGLKDKAHASDEEWPLTDRIGHRTVVLKPKPREGDPKVNAESSKTVDVPVTSIYITQTMWKNFKDRPYKHATGLSATSERRFQTPSNASIPGTPMSRSRRDPLNPLAMSIHRASSVASNYATGIFTNTAFALSFSHDDSERDAISALIINNGGCVLEDGFETLFQLTDGELTLKPEAASLGFVALISETHSRRTKYFQALALNFPCLAARWVRDCVTQSSIVAFGRYLLPAGTSAFLGGAVRSRTMALFDPAGPEALLIEVTKRRERLFRSAMVVFVSGRAKKGEERGKTYSFLCRALGAQKAVVVKDIDAARALLARDSNDNADKEGSRASTHNWVIVDGEKGSKAQSLLFPRAEKRKRDRDTSEDQGMVGSGVIAGRNVKVAGDEFVVQSLILGALCEG